MMNPDGYEFSRKEDRMWRKNRQKNAGSDCFGVDINRNFGKAYGSYSSDDPCDEDYRGNEAFSEPEAAALKKYIEDLTKKKIKYDPLNYLKSKEIIQVAKLRHGFIPLVCYSKSQQSISII